MRAAAASFLILAGALWLGAQQHANPPAGAAQPAGEHATPPAHGPDVPAEHHKPYLLFNKWEIPAPLVEIFRWSNFLVLFGLLLFMLRGPASEFFSSRREAIIAGLESGRRATEESGQKVREIERRLANLEGEIAALRADSSREAQAEAERLRQAARAETEKIFANAEHEMAALAKAARNDLRAYTAQLAVEMAEQRVRARMTPQKQSELVAGFAADLSCQEQA